MRFLKLLIRRKLLPIEGSVETSELKRSLTVFDLVFYGIGSMCGGNIYGISIVLLATTSGAGSFISCIIAGIVAALNAQSYAELSSRIPFSGGGYSFTYMICGEFFAFLTGWAMLLEYLLGFSFACVGAANAIDILANHTINNMFSQYVGDFPPTNGYLTSTPNILAGIIAVLILILLGFGAKMSFGVNSAVASFSTLLLLVCAVYMSFNLNIKAVLSYPVYPNDTVHDKIRSPFIPFGISGLIRGSAITFNSFSGFDALSLASAVVIDPKKAIPLSINIAIVGVFTITVFYYICLSLYQPWYLVDEKLGLSGVFYLHKIFFMQVLASLGEISGYFTSAFCNMFALSHIVLSMSRDGLIFKFFSYIQPTIQVPIYINLIFGFLAAILAIIFDLNIIANFMSAGVLINYTLVTINLLILRLVDVDKEEMNIPDSKIGLKLKYSKIKFKPLVENTNSCDANSFPKSFYLIATILMLVCSSLIWSFISINSYVQLPVALGVGITFGVITLYSVVVLHLYNYYEPVNSYFIRFVPTIPIVCIILNIILASQLNSTVWYRILIWMAIGMTIYFCYGIRNSRIIQEDDEKSLLIQQEEMGALALDTSN